MNKIEINPYSNHNQIQLLYSTRFQIEKQVKKEQKLIKYNDLLSELMCRKFRRLLEYSS